MTLTRSDKKRRLERAGFVYFEGGWLPADDKAGPKFQAAVASYEPLIEVIFSEAPRPTGRPRKVA
jgi:hypothetical protein